MWQPNKLEEESEGGTGKWDEIEGVEASGEGLERDLDGVQDKRVEVYQSLKAAMAGAPDWRLEHEVGKRSVWWLSRLQKVYLYPLDVAMGFIG